MVLTSWMMIRYPGLRSPLQVGDEGFQIDCEPAPKTLRETAASLGGNGDLNGTSLGSARSRLRFALVRLGEGEASPVLRGKMRRCQGERRDHLAPVRMSLQSLCSNATAAAAAGVAAALTLRRLSVRELDHRSAHMLCSPCQCSEHIVVLSTISADVGGKESCGEGFQVLAGFKWWSVLGRCRIWAGERRG